MIFQDLIRPRNPVNASQRGSALPLVAGARVEGCGSLRSTGKVPCSQACTASWPAGTKAPAPAAHLQATDCHLDNTRFRSPTLKWPVPGPRNRPRRGENEVELGTERDFHRLDAAGAGNLELTGERPLQPDVGHNILGTAVLMQHLRPSRGGQIAHLLRFFAQIDRTSGGSSSAKSISSRSSSLTLNSIL